VKHRARCVSALFDSVRNAARRVVPVSVRSAPSGLPVRVRRTLALREHISFRWDARVSPRSFALFPGSGELALHRCDAAVRGFGAAHERASLLTPPGDASERTSAQAARPRRDGRRASGAVACARGSHPTRTPHANERLVPVQLRERLPERLHGRYSCERRCGFQAYSA
jgi:hypothetical protein